MNKTINDQAAALSNELKTQLIQLARDGKSIGYIAKTHGLDYAVVQTYLWQSGNLPWRGAKTIITRRLKALKNATRRQERDHLIADIEEQVDYLYYAARQLIAQIDKVKKSIS